MTPRSVHPFHCIRFLHLDSGLSTNRDLPTKHSPRDTGMVPLSVPYAPTLTVGRADSESQSLLSNECGSSQFSEFSVLSSQRQPSPTESPIASHAVPEHYQSYWRLVGALDRLDTPVPKPPNTVAMQSPGDSERLERRIVSKRHADLPGSHSKRVKLSPSVTSSCMEEGPSTLKAPSSNHGKGVDFKSPFPLAGFVVFVDTRMEAGTPTSEYWGGILRGLGAQVTKTFASACTHVVFHRGHKGTVKQYKRTADAHRPIVVGVGWVDRCQKEIRYVEPTDYLVDLTSIPEESLKRRRRLNPPNLLTTGGRDDSFTEIPDSSPDPPSSIRA